MRVPRYSLAFEESGSKADLVTLMSLDTAPVSLSVLETDGQLRVSWQRGDTVEGFSYRVEGGSVQLVSANP